MTAAIDRLEKAGYARRARREADRRSVLVELTPLAQRWNAEIWGPLVQEGTAQLRRYSRAELALLKAFVAQCRDLQNRHIARVSGKT